MDKKATNAEAEKKRLQAKAYLEKQGQSVSTTTDFYAKMVQNQSGPSRNGDNTLELLLKATASAQSSSSAKKSEISYKKAILAQQQGLAVESSVENGWKKVFDQASQKHYYWHVETGKTSWEPPTLTESSSTSARTTNTDETLPENWIEKMHAATKQKYYYNTVTKESSFNRPGQTHQPRQEDNHHQQQQQQQQQQTTANKRQTEDKEDARKRSRTAVDPLDPTGGKVTSLHLLNCLLNFTQHTTISLSRTTVP